MITEAVITELERFVPTEEGKDVGSLNDILERLTPLAPALRAPVIPAILRLIERHPEAELGSPGPLVHALESIPGYESFLQDSVLRQPALLNIWMVNRILNSDISSDTRATWLGVLEAVTEHPLASIESQEMASDFLTHQANA